MEGVLGSAVWCLVREKGVDWESLLHSEALAASKTLPKEDQLKQQRPTKPYGVILRQRGKTLGGKRG